MKRGSNLGSTRRLARLLPLLLAVGQASAAEPAQPIANRELVTVTTSLVTPFFGAYEAEARIRASNNFGILVNSSYLTLEKGDWRTRAGTVGVGLTYYFRGDALRGWYVESVGELVFASWRHEPSNRLAPVGLGYTGIADVGYEFIWDQGPVLDLSLGVVVIHFPSARVDVDGNTVTSAAFTRFYPGPKVNVGWAF